MRRVDICLMKENDLNKVSCLYKSVYDKMNVGEDWNKKASYDLISYWYFKQPDLCFIAVVENKIVGGFVAGIKPWWDGNHLIDGEIFVDFNYQKNGIGTKLSKVMYKTALDKYKIVSIDFVTFNSDFPLNWYKKQGFKIEKNLVIINAKPSFILENL